jgi:hypothetical protein
MRAKDAGLTSLHSPRLLSTIRIVIESGAIYTTLILVLAVLRAIDHPGRFMVHCMVPPSAGELALRVFLGDGQADGSCRYYAFAASGSCAGFA